MFEVNIYLVLYNNLVPHYVYLIQCQDDSIYTGYTTDLDRRMLQHQTGDPKSAKYVRAKGFQKLLHHEIFSTRSLAMQREAEIKKLSRQNKMGLFITKLP